MDPSKGYLTDGTLTIHAEAEMTRQEPLADAGAVARHLAALLNDPAYSDLTLAAQDGSAVPVHRCIVAKHGGTLTDVDLFTKRRVVQVPDRGTLLQTVKFIYSGDAAGVEENSESLLNAAQMCKIVQLEELCVRRLRAIMEDVKVAPDPGMVHRVLDKAERWAHFLI